MPSTFEPHMSVLPPAQMRIWPRLSSARDRGFVLYGGTAVALRLGHRTSVDFDFFSSFPIEKDVIRQDFDATAGASVLVDRVQTLVISSGSEPVKLSFFGNIGFGRVAEPSVTADGATLVASPLDLLATKLNAILDRAEAKDYFDIAVLLRSGVRLEDGLGAFRTLFAGEPAQVLRALGYFEDGDLGSLEPEDRTTLIKARDNVRTLPTVPLVSRSLGPNLDQLG